MWGIGGVVRLRCVYTSRGRGFDSLPAPNTFHNKFSKYLVVSKYYSMRMIYRLDYRQPGWYTRRIFIKLNYRFVDLGWGLLCRVLLGRVLLGRVLPPIVLFLSWGWFIIYLFIYYFSLSNSNGTVPYFFCPTRAGQWGSLKQENLLTMANH